ncbi:hypothetical protein CEUSTIGMA_g8140.t1 [Chlamydomonas eustigma]|uniref:FCP1 homology domain-containing protein n=1 Tax=Chlamydomonas eustigma TaxID=1157962 RepID=A0A250XC88_9CHLO|nr:hypothetical protein CEUSTIGMA_g8140.t1 [Chlamydomonas eustigma]|eukprot:GAX80705.1 hypothetical protein CEUSTIGMA_g8140.t1 [Chlamydomonas eustigma]
MARVVRIIMLSVMHFTVSFCTAVSSNSATLDSGLIQTLLPIPSQYVAPPSPSGYPEWNAYYDRLLMSDKPAADPPPPHSSTGGAPTLPECDFCHTAAARDTTPVHTSSLITTSDEFQAAGSPVLLAGYIAGRLPSSSARAPLHPNASNQYNQGIVKPVVDVRMDPTLPSIQVNKSANKPLSSHRPQSSSSAASHHLPEAAITPQEDEKDQPALSTESTAHRRYGCVCAFDFDNTLRVPHGDDFDAAANEGPASVEACQALGCGLAMASANGNKAKLSKVLSEYYGAFFSTSFFNTSAFQIGQHNKSKELEVLSSYFQVASNSCIVLFDDMLFNKKYADQVGSVFQLVLTRTGIRLQDVIMAASKLSSDPACEVVNRVDQGDTPRLQGRLLHGSYDS